MGEAVNIVLTGAVKADPQMPPSPVGRGIKRAGSPGID